MRAEPPVPSGEFADANEVIVVGRQLCQIRAIAVSADPIEKARDLVKDELFSIAPAV